MADATSVTESNPLRQALPRARVPEPCAIVLFGSTGDLAHRKLVPALYHLARAGNLPSECAIVGFARRDWTDDDLRADYEKSLVKNGGSDFREIWPQFASRLVFTPGTFDDAESYRKLKEKLEELDRSHGTRGNRIFYLAVSPEFFSTIIAHLGEAGLIHPWQQDSPWSRVVIEKPFGRDLASAGRSIATSRACSTRARSIASTITWARRRSRTSWPSGSATASSSRSGTAGTSARCRSRWPRKSGMEGGRGAYYDTAGAIRDMVQNHMMQLLSLVAMEPPVDLSADAVRNEKVKVLQSLPHWKPEDVYRNVVRAQYAAGSIEGVEVPGYLNEKGVKPDSRTEPYVAMRLELNTWRWAGVPVLPPHGQAAAQAGHRDRHPVPQAPDRALRARGRRPQRGQPARPADPAERGGQPRLRGQDPRLAAEAPGSADGLPLRHRLRRPAAGGLRATAARRDARRPDPLHSHRRGRECMAVHHVDPRRLAAAGRPAAGDLCRRELGAGPRPMSCSKAGRSGEGSEGLGRVKPTDDDIRWVSPTYGCRDGVLDLACCPCGHDGQIKD